MQVTNITRRDFLKSIAASICAGGVMSVAAGEARRLKPTLVAAVITIYEKNLSITRTHRTPT